MVGFDGGKAVRATVTKYANNGDIFWLPTAIPVTAGKQYQFSNYSRSDVSTVILATYLTKSGTASYATLATVPASTTWKQNTLTFTIPAGITQVKIQQIIRAVGYLETDAYSLQDATGTTSPR